MLEGGLEVYRKNVQLVTIYLFNTSEMWLWYYAIRTTMLASSGSYNLAYKWFSWTVFPTPILSLWSTLFLPPEIKKMFFVVCCSIHIPSPSSLPSFLYPHCNTSPSSLRHESRAQTHTSHHGSDERMKPVSCSGHYLASQQLPGSHFWCTEFTTSLAIGAWVFV